MRESRAGGTEHGGILEAGDLFLEKQATARNDIGVVAHVPLQELGELHLRASAVRQDHDHRFGDLVDDDRHDTAFAEASVAFGTERTHWVGGLAFQRDAFRSRGYPAFDYVYRAPGAFAQVEHEVGNDLKLAGSARLDLHSHYGNRFSPRVSVLYRPGPWTFRASLGEGFHAPTPFMEEIDAIGLSRLQPLSGLDAETATATSVELGFAEDAWETSITLFASDLRNTTRFEPIASSGSAHAVRIVNVEGTTRIRGSELLVRHRHGQMTVTGSYVFTDAREPARTGIGRGVVPLTPRHTAGLVAMWEAHGKGRIGFEAYYTGAQALDDNPYRTRSPDYWELGILGEIVLGRMRLFLNAENLLDVRQSRYDPLPLPQRRADGRRAVDVWGPTDGFIVNGGIRLQF